MSTFPPRRCSLAVLPFDFHVFKSIGLGHIDGEEIAILQTVYQVVY